MMADELPVIPKTQKIIVKTGNIVNWQRLKKNLPQTPTDELSECLTSTLKAWVLKKSPKSELQYSNEIEACNPKYEVKLENDHREEYKVTVKLFLFDLDPKHLDDAIDKVLDELDTTYIETLLLSVPREHRKLADLLPLWEVLERRRADHSVFSLGLCDADLKLIDDFYNSAMVQSKPSYIQLNPQHGDCCVPADLQNFARQKDIQLLTHGDPPEILPPKVVQSCLAEVFTPKDADHWEVSWVARYSVLIRCRGVIKTKGYVLRLDRDLKQRK